MWIWCAAISVGIACLLALLARMTRPSKGYRTLAELRGKDRRRRGRDVAAIRGFCDSIPPEPTMGWEQRIATYEELLRMVEASRFLFGSGVDGHIRRAMESLLLKGEGRT